MARDLLGKFIVRRFRGRDIAAMIAEAEAYRGPADRACHTYGGRRTARVEPLWGDGGTVYVYLCYGMHWMLNFATAGAEKPEGVLIRGVLADGETPVIGPGRVTRHLRVNRSLDGLDVVTSPLLRIEDRGVKIPARRILTGPRIGVESAGTYWAAKPWRFRIEVGWPSRRRGR